MIVAQLRGARFRKGEDGYRYPIDTYISNKALYDVAEWLGYGSATEYTLDLEILKEKIFTKGK